METTDLPIPMPDPLVEVRDLQFTYPDGTQALAGIDFVLYPGETVALFGANGSGKTTFVLHLNGLLRGSGLVRVCGRQVSKDNLAYVRQKVGLVFQDSDDQLFMPTVLEDVMFGPRNMGLPADSARGRALAALEAVGAREYAAKPPFHLSAGEKKRVAIAGILAMEPEILVLDEPTTYLDPPGQAALAALLRRLPQAKLLVTHDLPFAAGLASRAVFFEAGRIAGAGSVGEITGKFAWSAGQLRCPEPG